MNQSPQHFTPYKIYIIFHSTTIAGKIDEKRSRCRPVIKIHEVSGWEEALRRCLYNVDTKDREQLTVTIDTATGET